MKTTTSAPVAGSVILAELQAGIEKHATAAPDWRAAARKGFEVASIVAALDAEREIIAGAMLQPLLGPDLIEETAAATLFGESIARFAKQLNQLGEFQAGAQWTPDRALSAGQADALRRMLLAVVTDPRLVLVRLAEQLRRMREARSLDEAARLKVAWETREIYAPLANRLGIWQLKWELEDLAFRYLEPADYRRIAGQLNETRTEREAFIESVRKEIIAELERIGVKAEVVGRPKHIYSIWRKMRRKGLAFDQVFDIRAVRIIVETVADCYAALGAVHGHWHYIPGEFDDYIATPKDNLYRSLHTAVIGPGAVPLEIQIRTRDMHEHAELGVAAHWRYKEGGTRDAAYDRKIEWLRELLAPAAESESDSDFLNRVRADLFEDRVYALTPKGEVIDLPSGATPLDFAYHVHTDLGHRCRGARVNGRIVPLDHRLANGEVVEIIRGKQAQPSRDWLIEQQGFLASPRSRAKVRAWFKKRDVGQNRADGRAMLEQELQRADAPNTLVSELLGEFGVSNADALYLALGSGDLTVAQLAGAIQRRMRGREAVPAAAVKPAVKPARRDAAGAVEIEGIGDLVSVYARCCNPLPPEPVTGYVTVGRGVTIHRSSCSSLARIAARAPERLLQVEWGRSRVTQFQVDIAIHAMDRRGLVRDVSTLLADEKINIERLTTRTDPAEGSADLSLRIAVSGLDDLSRLLARMAALPGVISARRRV